MAARSCVVRRGPIGESAPGGLLIKRWLSRVSSISASIGPEQTIAIAWDNRAAVNLLLDRRGRTHTTKHEEFVHG